LMHDWWIYLIISALGKVIYDDRPSIRYRQHNQNAVGGVNRLFIKNIKKVMPFLRNIRSSKNRTTDQAKEFNRIFGDYLNKAQLANINEFIHAKTDFKRRIKLVLSKKFNRQNSIDNFFYKMQILLGKY
jgi:hypothetical protein